MLEIDDSVYVRKSDAQTRAIFALIAHRYKTGSLALTTSAPLSQ